MEAYLIPKFFEGLGAAIILYPLAWYFAGKQTDRKLSAALHIVGLAVSGAIAGIIDFGVDMANAAHTATSEQILYKAGAQIFLIVLFVRLFRAHARPTT